MSFGSIFILQSWLTSDFRKTRGRVPCEARASAGWGLGWAGTSCLQHRTVSETREAAPAAPTPAPLPGATGEELTALPPTTTSREASPARTCRPFLKLQDVHLENRVQLGPLPFKSSVEVVLAPQVPDPVYVCLIFASSSSRTCPMPIPVPLWRVQEEWARHQSRRDQQEACRRVLSTSTPCPE